MLVAKSFRQLEVGDIYDMWKPAGVQRWRMFVTKTTKFLTNTSNLLPTHFFMVDPTLNQHHVYQLTISPINPKSWSWMRNSSNEMANDTSQKTKSVSEKDSLIDASADLDCMHTTWMHQITYLSIREIAADLIMGISSENLEDSEFIKNCIHFWSVA